MVDSEFLLPKWSTEHTVKWSPSIVHISNLPLSFLLILYIQLRLNPGNNHNKAANWDSCYKLLFDQQLKKDEKEMNIVLSHYFSATNQLLPTRLSNLFKHFPKLRYFLIFFMHWDCKVLTPTSGKLEQSSSDWIYNEKMKVWWYRNGVYLCNLLHISTSNPFLLFPTYFTTSVNTQLLIRIYYIFPLYDSWTLK